MNRTLQHLADKQKLTTEAQVWEYIDNKHKEIYKQNEININKNLYNN